MKPIKKSKLKKYKGRILDLHKVSHADVPEILSDFLHKSIDKERMPVEVITGKSSTMKGVVNSVVSYLGYMSVREPASETTGKLIIDLDVEE
jgi:DNA-nicking Smr family endonuclease|tara:strand:+ start:87 stop:362 length:276 start_codon:yes stop_codon:yes gene_type:complete